jgi:hypothetical protein
MHSPSQRFESAIALVLTVVIAMVIVVALYWVSAEVIGGLVFGRRRETRLRGATE